MQVLIYCGWKGALLIGYWRAEARNMHELACVLIGWCYSVRAAIADIGLLIIQLFLRHLSLVIGFLSI